MSAFPHIGPVVQPSRSTFRSMTRSGNQFVLRAHALSGCGARGSYEVKEPIITKPRLPIRVEVPNPSTAWGPTTRLGNPHQTTLDSQFHHPYEAGPAHLSSPPRLPPSVGFPIRAQVPNPSTTWGATTRLGNPPARGALRWTCPQDVVRARRYPQVGSGVTNRARHLTWSRRGDLVSFRSARPRFVGVRRAAKDPPW